jgi:TrmH family RNA methyltransferase
MAEVRRISSRSNPLLVRLRKLANDPLDYRRQGEVWLEGEHLCAARAAHGGRIAHALISEPAWERSELRSLAQRADTVTLLPQSLLESLGALESTQPLAFVAAWPGPGQLRTDLPCVVLDRVQDAGNVGTIVRCAAAFGFGQVLALRGTAGLWSPKVLRAGMGAHFGVNLVESLDEAELAVLQIPLFAASPHAAYPIDRAKLPWPCGWVFGHEGGGVCEPLLARCHAALRIPQPGGEESLNVGAAAAVCLYETMRQRLQRSECA